MADSPALENSMQIDNDNAQSLPQSTRASSPATSDNQSDDAPAVDLLVTSRPRRTNAGNRMSMLLAKAAEEEGLGEGDEEWGDDWNEAANEEDFVGGDINEADDYNLASSSSSEDEDEGDDDDAGEKELQKAERQERVKKRKAGGASNPLQASLARMAARKRAKLSLDASTSLPGASSVPRPKKKSERASWIPTPEDGPIRMSARKQTVANKEHTLSKLKEKDRRREDTLAMMKAAEARKAKDEPKAMTQAERLAEAARVERVNSKSLHRWEEEEMQRAAERQAKIDALKNRQIEGPFVRYWSGPAIWVDDKLKYTGKDAPKVEDLDEKLNKEVPAEQTMEKAESAQPSVPAPSTPASNSQYTHPQLPQEMPAQNGYPNQPQHQPPPTPQPSSAPSQTHSVPSQPPLTQKPHIPPSANGNTHPQTSNTAYPSSIMFPQPSEVNHFLSGIEHYANNQPPPPPHQHQQQHPLTPQTPHMQPSTPYNAPPFPFFPPNPWSQTPHPSLSDPVLTSHPQTAQSILQQCQRPPPPPAPPRRKLIRKALRNLLILTNFPHLTAPPAAPSRSRTATTKEKDRAALIQLSTTLFGWSVADASAFVTAMLNAPKTSKKEKGGADKGARKEVCVVTNKVARYRDPGTGIPYHDSKAFGVLRGVVSGEFVWSPALGCYVGGRPKGVGAGAEEKGMGKSRGVEPVKGVPRRFWDPGYVPPPPPPSKAQDASTVGAANGAGPAAGLAAAPASGAAPPQVQAGPSATVPSPQAPIAGPPPPSNGVPLTTEAPKAAAP